MVIYVSEAPRPGAGPAPMRELGLVFDRSGFADWKLTAIRLPAA